MQTLWTRVAQVRGSCYCPQCVSSTHAVARRSAGTAIRRPSRFWTTSTVWYSGIFAVAATLDMGFKQQRREQWNKAIADVKQELGAVDEGDTKFLNAMEQDFVASEDMRKNLDSTPFRDRRPQWPESTGQDRWDGRLAPDSIYASDIRKRKALQRRWKPKKLERVQLSVDVLQLEFFAELHRRGWCQEAANAVPAKYANYVIAASEGIHRALATKHSDLERLLNLKGQYSYADTLDEESADAEFQTWRRSDSDEPLCDYRQDDNGEFHRTTHELNTCLQDLFDIGRRRELPQPVVLAKIYHNLSLSSAPPNVDTFNTMIVGLSDIGTRRLVEDCINAFRATQIRTNEVSLASILNYYTLTDNPKQFNHWVKLMRGDFGGLQTAQPNTDITPSSQGRLIRKKNKVIQLPSPTPMVFSALVKGVVKFSGLEAAIKICTAMRDEGWGLSMSGLQPLLKACAEAGDWAAGLQVWKAILELKHRATARRHVEWQARAVNLPTFASMLNLCSRCGQRSAFEDVMNQAMAAHPRHISSLIAYLKADRAAEDHGKAERLAAARSRRRALGPDLEKKLKYVELLDEPGRQDIVWTAIPDIQKKRRFEKKKLKRNQLKQNSTSETHSDDKSELDVRSGSAVLSHKAVSHCEPLTATTPVGHEVPSQIAGPEPATDVVRVEHTCPADRLQTVVLSQEHLYGYIPFTQELEDYENGERPMSIAT